MWPLLLSLAHADCTPPARNDPLTISIVTISPADPMFTRFGHSALWVGGGGIPEDRIFNWGTFNSHNDNPVVSFLQGRMIYWLALSPYGSTVERARKLDRTIIVQRLQLPPAADEELIQVLKVWTRPENRKYRYHWSQANCSTIIRDVLDTATGGALRASVLAAPDYREPGTAHTARQEVLRHLGGSWPVWFGWHFMADRTVDVPMDPWAAAFVPERLMQLADAATLPWPDGQTRPLVEERCTVHQGGHPFAPPQSPDRRLPMALLGLTWGGLAAGLGARGRRRMLGLSTLSLGLLAGLLGTATLTLWLSSQIENLGPNENWLQGNPLTLGLVVIGLVMLRRAPGRLAVAWAMGLAAVATLGALAGIALPQHNIQIVALLLPALIGTAVGVGLIRRQA